MMDNSIVLPADCPPSRQGLPFGLSLDQCTRIGLVLGVRRGLENASCLCNQLFLLNASLCGLLLDSQKVGSSLEGVERAGLSHLI
jgi:hypothetical protein